MLLGAWLAATVCAGPQDDSVSRIWGAAAVASVIATAGRPSPGGRRIRAAKDLDAVGRPTRFCLELDRDRVPLEPGIPWSLTDHYKWVTRGLIEPPQSYHVLPDGAVDINGQHIALNDPEGETKLEEEINKRHSQHAAKTEVAPPPRTVAPSAGSGNIGGKVRFSVHMDHMGHLLVAAQRGGERLETGLRGLNGLVQNGLMLRPRAMHVDPMQRAVELDGERFEANAAGALALEAVLNDRYAPTIDATAANAIAIRENPGSPTGFDIRFVTLHAGARTEIKGHLNEKHLELLQDPHKSDLLRPGVVLRLSPPYLLFRRRRADGGEEKIPELTDIHYMHTTAAQLERLLNHPLVRREGGHWEAQAGDPAQPSGTSAAPPPASETPKAAAERGARAAVAAHDAARLPAPAPAPAPAVAGPLPQRAVPEPKMESDHVAELRESPTSPTSAVFQVPQLPSPPRPSTLISTTPQEPTLHPSATPPTTPIKPPAAPFAQSAAPAASGSNAAAVMALASASAGAPVDPRIDARFRATDPLVVLPATFARLVVRTGLPVQDLLLSLPRVFEDRRFEVLSFNGQEITSVLDLRSPEFYGFYLSHLDAGHLSLVYACQGHHVEWGVGRCLLQSALSAEADEFKGAALLGLAQDDAGDFVFIIEPACRAWARPREREYSKVFARFISPAEYGAEPGAYTVIWPDPPTQDAAPAGA
jgi:hypothetical protein